MVKTKEEIREKFNKSSTLDISRLFSVLNFFTDYNPIPKEDWENFCIYHEGFPSYEHYLRDYQDNLKTFNEIKDEIVFMISPYFFMKQSYKDLSPEEKEKTESGKCIIETHILQ